MGKYQVIYADPPWAYRVWSKKGNGRSAESHYPTMSIEEMLIVQDQVWNRVTVNRVAHKPYVRNIMRFLTVSVPENMMEVIFNL